MYQAIYFQKNKDNKSHIKNGTIHLWDDSKGYLRFPYSHYAYKKDPHGNYTSIDGVKVKKVKNWTREDEEKGLIYEGDIRPEVRTIIDMYGDSDDMSKNHTHLFWDIEVSSIGGYAEPESAKNEITAICYYTTKEKLYHVLLLDKTNSVKPKRTNKYELNVYSDEKQLLISFINQFKAAAPTVISGWNSEMYDVPYMCNRILKVLGIDWLNKLSPIGIVEYSERDETYSIAGVTHLDYMKLYKGYNQNELPSYALDAVGKKELGRGKVKYKGSLDDLYRTDLEKFIEYNMTDVELIVEIDKKNDFLDLAKTVCHKGHVPYEFVYNTSWYLDGAALTFTKRMNLVCPSKNKPIRFKLERDHNENEQKIYMKDNIDPRTPKSGTLKFIKKKTSVILADYLQYKDNYFILSEPLDEDISEDYDIKLDLAGAFVKEPVIGKHKWIYDLDLKALYPNIIITLNISLETLVGQVLNWDSLKYITREKDDTEYIVQIGSKKNKMTNSELNEFLCTNKYSIAANGAFFRTDIKGLIPSILEIWAKERDDLKEWRADAKKKNDMNLFKYYNLRQLATKRMLNSFYGVMALAAFRLYNMSNAEAITSTGQEIIKFTGKMADHYYNQYCSTNNEPYLIYTDTDSIFLSALPLIKVDYPDCESTKDNSWFVTKTIEYSKNVQNFINEGYDYFADRFLNVGLHTLQIKQENVAKAGLWVAKKRYAQWMLFMEGMEMEELDVKGLDAVRSDFPNSFKKIMKEILIGILRDDMGMVEINKMILDFKQDMKRADLFDIMMTSAIKNIVKCDSKTRPLFKTLKGTPAHVKSGLMFNDMLVYNKIKETPRIKNGEKVKWAYLKKNPMNISQMALRGLDDPDMFVDYVSTYIDREQIFTSKLKNKLQQFYVALKWGALPVTEASDKFFSFV